MSYQEMLLSTQCLIAAHGAACQARQRLTNGTGVDVIYFEYANVFEKVNHQLLLKINL